MEKQQRFIDIEILKRYRTASDEQKKLLHKIYGKDTFETDVDDFEIIYAFIMDNYKKNGDKINFDITHTYPIQFSDQGINVEVKITENKSVEKHFFSGSKIPGAYTEIITFIRNLRK